GPGTRAGRGRQQLDQPGGDGPPIPGLRRRFRRRGPRSAGRRRAARRHCLRALHLVGSRPPANRRPLDAHRRRRLGTGLRGGDRRGAAGDRPLHLHLRRHRLRGRPVRPGWVRGRAPHRGHLGRRGGQRGPPRPHARPGPRRRPRPRHRPERLGHSRPRPATRLPAAARLARAARRVLPRRRHRRARELPGGRRGLRGLRPRGAPQTRPRDRARAADGPAGRTRRRM
ncbi:MAG: hypothetical protein AVDCRST_MAG04-2004, partial [uncultured Acetobacteraceae bacterium]